MPVPERVAKWVSQNYPRPVIDAEWLSDCCDWISSTYSISPSTHFHDFITHVEAQLLQSNLEDSTVPGTGLNAELVRIEERPLPRRPRGRGNKPSSRATRKPMGQSRQRQTTGSVPLLVEIRSITEIAHSAFSLLNIHQTRLDRADLGLAVETQDRQEQGQQDEDQGPIPRFPRGMLRFELSDGHTLFQAIEFRSIPELVLGETPLGFKMFLTSTPIRNGIAFLQPSNVKLKGYRTEDHDVHRVEIFLKGLRRRLGRPEPEPEAPRQLEPQPRPAAPPMPPPVAAHLRPPPPPAADDDDMYEDDEIDPDVLDALDQIETRAASPPKPAKLAARDLVQDLPGHITPISNTAAQSANLEFDPRTTRTVPSIARQQTSLHFSSPEKGKATSTLVPDIGLSPIRVQKHDFGFTWDSDESEAFRAFGEGPNGGTGPVAKANARVRTMLPMKPDPAIEDNLKATLISPSNVNIAPSWGVRPKVRSTTSNGSSLEPLDSFSMDMEFDDDFLAQVEEAEKQALALTETSVSLVARHTSDKGKGKASSIPLGSPNSATRPVSNSVRTQSTSDARDSSVREEVAPYPPPLTQLPRRARGSPHPLPPTQPKPTKRYLTRDPTVIVVSSSDSENGGACAEDQFESEWAGLGISGKLEDVIDISD